MRLLEIIQSQQPDIELTGVDLDELRTSLRETVSGFDFSLLDEAVMVRATLNHNGGRDWLWKGMRA